MLSEARVDYDDAVLYYLFDIRFIANEIGT